MEYYFDPDDKLNRLRYAEFLKSMLENCDKYRREDSDGAYVIAIDSPWGTGKTRFAKMLRNHLEGRKPQLIEGKVDQGFIPKPDINRKFNVIYYNSWETDYWTDAIEPLISTIINSDVFKEFREDAQNKELWNQFIQFSKGVLEASVDIAAGYSSWGIILKVLIHGIKKVRENIRKPFAEYEKKTKLYCDFADSLSAIIRKTKKKLIIIVDELDRCRPPFAVQTLELVKHLFAVNGLVFIFALDVLQLSSAVRTIYGSDMDEPGYLCRFFDYVGKMPKPNTISFVKEQIHMVTPSQKFYKEGEFQDILSNYLANLQISFQLSLRDISTLIATYKVLFGAFLSEYADISAHELYLILLCIKFKKQHHYEQLCFGRFTENEIDKLYQEPISVSFGIEELSARRLKYFAQNIQIEERTYPTYECIHKMRYEDRLFDKFVLYQQGENSQLHYFLKTPHSNNVEGLLFEDTDNLGQVLFYEDLRKWGMIKEMTIGQYYYQQLEMFNFALPADEPTVQS